MAPPQCGLSWAAVGAVFLLAIQAFGQSVVISQVYGGGGNSGATYRSDFIELFNRGQQPVNLNNWTVQYASASGNSWDRTVIQGIIQPGQYYLVREGQGDEVTRDLPKPDAAGGIALSATAGKVALVTNSTLLTGTSPVGTQIADFVGYGNANFAEGSPAGSILICQEPALIFPKWSRSLRPTSSRTASTGGSVQTGQLLYRRPAVGGRADVWTHPA